MQAFSLFNALSTNPTKCGKSRRIVWVCLTILWGWCFKGKKLVKKSSRKAEYDCHGMRAEVQIYKNPSKRSKWEKVFKSELSEFCGMQPLNIWRSMVCLGRPHLFKFFKDCLPQILFGPFLNTLSQMM